MEDNEDLYAKLTRLLTTDSELNTLVQQLLEQYKGSLARNKINASGNLSNTTQAYSKVEGSSLGKYEYQVIFDLADYWFYVENGRRPGKRPPISAIEQWLADKGVQPHPRANGNIPSTKQLAFAISNKIAREGTQYYQMGGTQVLHDAINEQSPVLDAIVDRIGVLLDKEITSALDTF